jgi:predicted adenine nucleotide alpha hydrolase (AANH) superfamily ATPase
MNTKGHTQWYYFKIVYKDIALHADKKTHKIKFNILNLAKTSSLYQQGMKPCIFSKKRNLNEKIGWFKGGDDITYKQNAIPRYDN